MNGHIVLIQSITPTKLKRKMLDWLVQKRPRAADEQYYHRRYACSNLLLICYIQVMKKLIVLSTFFVSLLLATAVSARWTNIIRDHSGITFYLDVLRIVKNERYVYFWELIDYLEPTETGVLSHEVFAQGDCKLNLSLIHI